jgi:hypothetical protein
MMEIIIFWLVGIAISAAIGYALGAAKDNGSLGLLLGLVLGPLGWLLIVLLNLGKKTDDEGAAQYLLLKQQNEMLQLNRAQQVRREIPVPEMKKVRIKREGKVIGNWPLDEVRERLETGELVWEDLYFEAAQGEWVQLAGHPEV